MGNVKTQTYRDCNKVIETFNMKLLNFCQCWVAKRLWSVRVQRAFFLNMAFSTLKRDSNLKLKISSHKTSLSSFLSRRDKLPLLA